MTRETSTSKEKWEPLWIPMENSRSLSGGQGTVTKVVHSTSGVIGALKQLHSSHLNNRERRQRMAREVLALEQIQGERVPQVLDHNMDSEDCLGIPLYFVMRWIDGQTLQQLTGGKHLSVNQAIEITHYLAITLNRCHAAGILHRDIKPENIIIDKQSGHPILVDFGLAWTEPLDKDTDSLTSIGQELGNRFFRLPDLAVGQQKHDMRTDVTFLVGILFFLLTGVAPRVLIDSKGLPPDKALIHEIPENVLTDKRWPMIRRIFRVGFQPSIDYRFQSTIDLIQRLEELTPSSDIKEKSVEYQTEVDAIQELLELAIFASTQQIEEAVYASSKKLLEKLQAMASEVGLGVSTGDYRKLGRSVICHFSLHVPRSGISSNAIFNYVEFDALAKGSASASYQLGQTETYGKAENPRVVYYRGPAADVERLEEEILGHAGEMFKLAADDLHKRLESTLK